MNLKCEENSDIEFYPIFLDKTKNRLLGKNWILYYEGHLNLKEYYDWFYEKIVLKSKINATLYLYHSKPTDYINYNHTKVVFIAGRIIDWVCKKFTYQNIIPEISDKFSETKSLGSKYYKFTDEDFIVIIKNLKKRKDVSIFPDINMDLYKMDYYDKIIENKHSENNTLKVCFNIKCGASFYISNNEDNTRNICNNCITKNSSLESKTFNHNKDIEMLYLKERIKQENLIKEQEEFNTLCEEIEPNDKFRRFITLFLKFGYKNEETGYSLNEESQCSKSKFKILEDKISRLERRNRELTNIISSKLNFLPALKEHYFKSAESFNEPESFNSKNTGIYFFNFGPADKLLSEWIFYQYKNKKINFDKFKNCSIFTYGSTTDINFMKTNLCLNNSNLNVRKYLNDEDKNKYPQLNFYYVKEELNLKLNIIDDLALEDFHLIECDVNRNTYDNRLCIIKNNQFDYLTNYYFTKIIGEKII